MLRLSTNFLAAAAIAALTFTALSAQEVDIDAGRTPVDVDRQGVRVESDGTPRDVADRRVRDGQSMNRQITQWLLVDQRSIVDLAQFGLQRTKTPEVRQLAEAIVRDHSALLEKLSARTGNRIGTSETNAERRQANRVQRDRSEERRDADGARRPLENLADRLEDGAERLAEGAERVVDDTRESIDRRFGDDRAMRGGSGTWVTIHRQVTERLNKAARQDLERRSGYEFDAALVGMFVATHLQQEATLEVLSEKATGELKTTIDNALPSVRSHRQQAEQVMTKIKR